MECSRKKIQFTQDLNQCQYFVDNSVEGDTIIVRMHSDPSKNYSVNCREKGSQTPQILKNKFNKYKSFVNIIIQDSIITAKYSNVADAVDCLRDMMNDKENPSFGMQERLLGGDKTDFIKDLKKYKKLNEYSNALTDKKKEKEQSDIAIKKTTPNRRDNKQKKWNKNKYQQSANVQTSESKINEEVTPIKKFCRIKRNWISQEVLNSIVETLDTKQNEMETLLAQIEEIKIEPPTIPPLMHSVDLYMDSRVENLPLFDVLITGFPNHLSYNDIRSIALTCTDRASLQNVNVMEEIIHGVERRFCIVYLTSRQSADYLVKGLNKATVKGKRLSAVTFSDLDAQWRKLHKTI